MWLNILQLHDQDLFDHLEDLSVLPTTFGINWTKLLFSRFVIISFTLPLMAAVASFIKLFFGIIYALNGIT